MLAAVDVIGGFPLQSGIFRIFTNPLVLLGFAISVAYFIYSDAKRATPDDSRVAEIWALAAFISFVLYFWLGIVVLVAYLFIREQRRPATSTTETDPGQRQSSKEVRYDSRR